MVKQAKKQPLWRRMREAYDRATGHCLRGELLGCRQLTLQGCKKILEYGDRCIRLALRDPDASEIVVHGAQLLCLSYHPDAVVVQGRIRRIELAGGDLSDEYAQVEDV